MPLSYCSCAVRGSTVHMELDLDRPGKYRCMGCGASEEVVMETAAAMQEQWTKAGKGYGHMPELLQPYAIDGDPTNVTLYKEPTIELLQGSERSLKEIEQMQKEARNG